MDPLTPAAPPADPVAWYYHGPGQIPFLPTRPLTRQEVRAWVPTLALALAVRRTGCYRPTPPAPKE